MDDNKFSVSTQVVILKPTGGGCSGSSNHLHIDPESPPSAGLRMTEGRELQSSHRLITYFLWLCAFMVFMMIGLGGYTRLSGAGLSIVVWQPVIGIFPPLSENTWQTVFEQYQLSPEFQQVNFGMTLAEFKIIYFIEYLHRLWGRAIGLVLLIPTLYALFKARPLLPKLGLIWVLGGLQGLMGWYMVKSGLINDPMVSPYRLMIHLILALGILGVILHTIFRLRSDNKSTGNKKNQLLLTILLLLISVTICYGALTAGFHAGLIYNTYPDMNGKLLPDEVFYYAPWWYDLIANPATIQFIHRILALTTLTFGLYVSMTLWSQAYSMKLRHIGMMIGLALSLQVALGIFTLVLHVPILLAVFHQVWAVITFSTILWAYFLCKYSPTLSQSSHILV